MVKMILALPSHIDAEKFVDVTMDVIKGRYGQFSYYGDVKPQISAIVRVADLPKVFVKAFSGKNKVFYFYEIDARELDPVIIATLEEIGQMIGMKYGFATDFEIISRDWWRPYGNFQDAPTYCESAKIENYRAMYDEVLIVLDKKSA